ncbi:DUF4116 domain-containing protein [Clostridioides sp. ZZV14-6045]|nr:DUF4116 domain-containing protein [Clostridioides sp. ZZV14-6045]
MWHKFNFTEEQIYNLYLEAVRTNSSALKCVYIFKNLTQFQKDKLFKETITEFEAIRHIKNPTEELCLEAVKTDGLALEYVKKQTEEICIEAVKRDCKALAFVRWNIPNSVAYKICIEAIRQDVDSIRFIDWKILKNVLLEEQIFNLCIEAVKVNGEYIEYINWGEINISDKCKEKICIEALKQTGYALQFIEDYKKYEDIFNIKILEEYGDSSEVIAMKINEEWLFTIGCQDNITKEEFIYRIYNTDGGFDLDKGINPHRKRYIEFLEQFFKEKIDKEDDMNNIRLKLITKARDIRFNLVLEDYRKKFNLLIPIEQINKIDIYRPIKKYGIK